MKAFGIEEYGNKDGFTIKCNLCGKEGWVVPIHHCENGQVNKITLEFRCICGNRYGATIHEGRNNGTECKID